MTLGMFGRVKEQAEHRGRQPGSTDHPCRCEGVLIRPAQLVQGTLDFLMEGVHEIHGPGVRLGRLPLHGERL